MPVVNVKSDNVKIDGPAINIDREKMLAELEKLKQKYSDPRDAKIAKPPSS